MVGVSLETFQVSEKLKLSTTFFPYWKVMVSSVFICLGSFALGTVYAFTSPALPKMNDEPNPFRLNQEEQSWCVSTASFGGLIGGLFSQYMVDCLGRKLSMILSVVPLTTGWLVILCAQNPWMVMIGRAFTGFAVGVTWVCSPIYVAEISPAAHRGLLLMLHAFLVCFGVLWAYVIGQFFPWTWLTVSFLAFNVIMVAGISFIPESPRWLLLQGHEEAANLSLQWYRGNDDVSAELTEIRNNIRSVSQQKLHFGELLKKEFYHPLALSLVLVTVQIWGGLSVIDAYTVDIFRSGGSTIDPYLATSIIGVVQVVGNFHMFYLMDKAGRKPMLVISGIGMAISLIALALFFKIKTIDSVFADEYLFWLPIASIIFYYLTFDLGWSPIPPAMAGELLPIRTRGLAGGISVAWAWISIFLSTKFYVNMVDAIGEFGSFLIYAAFAIFGVIFSIVCLPETKNKSLEEIEKSFRKE